MGEGGDVGARLREERRRLGISQRELARRVGVSASLISQIESGRSKPSVSTLYALVTELDISLDHLFLIQEDVRSASEQPVAIGETEAHAGPLVHPNERHVVELASGVRQERLTSYQHEDVDFLHITYDVDRASALDKRLMRHPGREYGIVVSGRLGLQLGSERYELGPGDSIAFDSTKPHQLWNLSDKPVHGIWFVVHCGG